MKLKSLFNIFYHLFPPLMLCYIFISLGAGNLASKLALITMPVAMVVLFVKLIGVLLRIVKLYLLNNQYGLLENSRLCVAARLGNELSIFGYFFPMMHENYRNQGTFSALVIDKIMEILATFCLVFIFTIPILGQGDLYLIILVLSFICVGAVVGSLFLPLGMLPENRYTAKVISYRAAALAFVRDNLRLCVWLFILTLCASILEFWVVALIFFGLGEDVALGTVAIIWAVGGILTNLMMISIGPAEMSTLYLYKMLAGISYTPIASMIIIAKFTTLFSLSIIYLINWLVKTCIYRTVKI